MADESIAPQETHGIGLAGYDEVRPVDHECIDDGSDPTAELVKQPFSLSLIHI